MTDHLSDLLNVLIPDERMYVAEASPIAATSTTADEEEAESGSFNTQIKSFHDAANARPATKLVLGIRREQPGESTRPPALDPAPPSS